MAKPAGPALPALHALAPARQRSVLITCSFSLLPCAAVLWCGPWTQAQQGGRRKMRHQQAGHQPQRRCACTYMLLICAPDVRLSALPPAPCCACRRQQALPVQVHCSHLAWRLPLQADAGGGRFSLAMYFTFEWVVEGPPVGCQHAFLAARRVRSAAGCWRWKPTPQRRPPRRAMRSGHSLTALWHSWDTTLRVRPPAACPCMCGPPAQQQSPVGSAGGPAVAASAAQPRAAARAPPKPPLPSARSLHH